MTAPFPCTPKKPVSACGDCRCAGFTLLETFATLALISVLLAWSLPRFGSAFDRWAVLGARETVVASIGAARAVALERGGGWLAVDSDQGRMFWGAGADSLGERWISDEWGVRLSPGSAGARAVRFDDLGLGQVASRTFTVEKGTARGGVSLSSYGRIRRW